MKDTSHKLQWPASQYVIIPYKICHTKSDIVLGSGQTTEVTLFYCGCFLAPAISRAKLSFILNWRHKKRCEVTVVPWVHRLYKLPELWQLSQAQLNVTNDYDKSRLYWIFKSMCLSIKILEHCDFSGNVHHWWFSVVFKHSLVTIKDMKPFRE